MTDSAGTVRTSFTRHRMRSPLSPLVPLARPLLVAACTGAGFLALGVSDAAADLRVCNGTQSLVGVAIGYRGEEGWISEGWWRIPATQCRSVVEGQLNSRYYYLYAEDAEGVGRWAGEVNFCIAENEFRVVGVEDCFTRGFQEMGFREYDTGAQASWMVNLTEAPRESAPAQAAPTAAPDEGTDEEPDGAQPAETESDGEPSAQ